MFLGEFTFLVINPLVRSNPKFQGRCWGKKRKIDFLKADVIEHRHNAFENCFFRVRKQTFCWIDLQMQHTTEWTVECIMELFIDISIQKLISKQIKSEILLADSVVTCRRVQLLQELDSTFKTIRESQNFRAVQRLLLYIYEMSRKSHSCLTLLNFSKHFFIAILPILTTTQFYEKNVLCQRFFHDYCSVLKKWQK